MLVKTWIPYVSHYCFVFLCMYFFSVHTHVHMCVHLWRNMFQHLLTFPSIHWWRWLYRHQNVWIIVKILASCQCKHFHQMNLSLSFQPSPSTSCLSVLTVRMGPATVAPSTIPGRECPTRRDYWTSRQNTSPRSLFPTTGGCRNLASWGRGWACLRGRMSPVEPVWGLTAERAKCSAGGSTLTTTCAMLGRCVGVYGMVLCVDKRAHVRIYVRTCVHILYMYVCSRILELLDNTNSSTYVHQQGKLYDCVWHICKYRYVGT